MKVEERLPLIISGMLRKVVHLVLITSMLAAGTTAFEETIRAWQKHRLEGLRSDSGWLTLVGLFWLKAGDNTIGSNAGNDFVLPKGSAPERAGSFRMRGTAVEFVPVHGTPQTMSYDEDKPDVVHVGTVSLVVIKRGDRLAVRAKDSASPVLKHFTGTEFFPVSEAMHFRGKLIPEKRQIAFHNILGQVEMQESPGRVEFAYQGKTYSLRPIFEDSPSGKTLFFLFRDSTNRSTTYQAGRMLNRPIPTDGVVDLDFNRAYNPPCTFTPYATCLLPPKENVLPFAVEAGEKRYGKGHAELGTK